MEYFYSKYTGEELEERLDRIDDIPELLAEMLTGKNYTTPEDALCIVKKYVPTIYENIPIDNNTIYWANTNDGKVLKARIILSDTNTDAEGECLWEKKTNTDGKEYLYSKLPVITAEGITMYADGEGLDIPSIYAGIPFDGVTIHFNKEGKVEVIGGTEGGVSNFWDLNDIPSWITNTKPIYSYSEIKGTPDLSNYVTKSYVDENFVTFTLDEVITGIKSFTNGLKIGESSIKQLQEDVVYIDANLVVRGGITMYGNDSEFVPSTIMDAILYDDTTLGINANGQLYVKGGTGGGGISSVTSQMIVDALGYTPASATALSGYLPLSGGTLSSTTGAVLQINTANAVEVGARFLVGMKNKGRVGYHPTLGTNIYNYASKYALGVKDDGGLFYDGGTIWHSGNDGSGSGLDADLLDGFHVNGSQKPYGKIPLIAPDGVMEVGKYIDFHNDNTTGSDFSTRLQCSGEHGNTISLPSANGTLALTSSNVASATKLQTARTIWGQSFDGTGNVSGNIMTGSHRVLGTYGGAWLYAGIRSGEAISIETTNEYGDWLSRGITILRNGNIGINTINPTEKLDINGNCRANHFVIKGATIADSNFPSIAMNYGNFISFGGYRAIRGEEAGLVLVAPSPNGGSIIFRPMGNTAASTQTSIDTSGNMLVSGGITMYSARKLKTIQDERGLSLEELSTIKPTRFTWKDGRDNKIHIGGIADDVQKVLPEVIYKADNDTLTMDYGNAAFAIAASLIKPVVNHEERIRLLEEENKRLKEEVEQLKWNIA